MKPRELRALLDRLVVEVPAAATAIGYERRSCILHTRVACDVLRERGVRARPLACSVIVANRQWLQHMIDLGRFPLVDELRDDEHSLGIGFGLSEGATPGYDGHVVTLVAERYVMDLTIDQASRPAKGIELAPSWFPVEREFLRGEKPVVARGEDGMAYVRYEALPRERGFLTTPDWIMHPSAGRVSPLPAVRAALAA